jgi:hypothetical protein
MVGFNKSPENVFVLRLMVGIICSTAVIKCVYAAWFLYRNDRGIPLAAKTAEGTCKQFYGYLFLNDLSDEKYYSYVCLTNTAKKKYGDYNTFCDVWHQRRQEVKNIIDLGCINVDCIPISSNRQTCTVTLTFKLTYDLVSSYGCQVNLVKIGERWYIDIPIEALILTKQAIIDKDYYNSPEQREEAAEKALSKAVQCEIKGNWDDAFLQYQDIISGYPDLQVAKDAGIALVALKKKIDNTP